MAVSIAVIGECMLELTHADISNGEIVNTGVTRPMAMGYGGDTINTSIYLSRKNVAVSYITGLGDDIKSDWLLEEWMKEGIDCSLVVRMPNSVPGIYMINVDENGERSFLYWRQNSPASRLFEDADTTQKLFQSIAEHEYLYLSGISLAILEKTTLDTLFNMLEEYREQGGKLIFDGNYRPKLWSSEAVAQEAYKRMYRMTDVALPTLEDEVLLFGSQTPEQLLEVITNYGVPETVVKMGANGCMASHNGRVDYVKAILADVVDTTAAGDSFNAGYLAARFSDCSVVDACHAGHALASKVIQHRGAIISQGV